MMSKEESALRSSDDVGKDLPVAEAPLAETPLIRHLPGVRGTKSKPNLVFEVPSITFGPAAVFFPFSLEVLEFRTPDDF